MHIDRMITGQADRRPLNWLLGINIEIWMWDRKRYRRIASADVHIDHMITGQAGSRPLKWLLNTNIEFSMSDKKKKKKTLQKNRKCCRAY